MKKKLAEKVLAIAMATAMVLPLAACGDDAGASSGANSGSNSGTQQTGTSQQSNAPEGSNDAVEPSQDEVDDDSPFAQYTKGEVAEDLNGYEFVIVDFGASRWYPGSSYPNVNTEQFDPTKEDHQLKDAIIHEVEDKFNCKITIQSEGPTEIFEAAQPAIMSGDKYADVIGVTEWGLGKLLSANLLLDISTVDSIDLTADYWNQTVIDFANFGGATYGIGGGFAPDLGNTAVVFYNVSIWEELKLPDPMELLKNNQWTWDKLLEYAKMATRDLDSDGKIDSTNDRYGLVGPHGGMAERMVSAMGENFIAKNADGTLSLGTTSDVAAEKLDFIYNLFQKENVIYMENDSDYRDRFAAGGALFMLYANMSGDPLREMEDDFGILPMPKWDSTQENYYCQVDSNAPIFCMTNTNQNTHEAGVILSALARRYRIFEDRLIADRADTFWRLEETEDIMHEYILPNRKYDVVMLIKETNDDFKKPTGIVYDAVHNNAFSDIASEMKAYEEQINIALDEFISNLKK